MRRQKKQQNRFEKKLKFGTCVVVQFISNFVLTDLSLDGKEKGRSTSGSKEAASGLDSNGRKSSSETKLTFHF